MGGRQDIHNGRRGLKMVVCSLFLCFAIVGNECEAAAEKVKIMFLGNSTTGSFDGRPSFRYFTWRMLEEGGYGRDQIDFVGYSCGVDEGIAPGRCGNPEIDTSEYWWDWNHEGLHGWSAQAWSEGFIDWRLGLVVPDIMCLHLGSVEIAGRQNLDSTKKYIGVDIDQIRGYNPSTVFLLAEIMPQAGMFMVDSVAKLNTKIRELAAEKSTNESPIYLVDHFNGFDISTMLADYVHPNREGEYFMGKRFGESLLPVLDSVARARAHLSLPEPQQAFKIGEPVQFEAIVQSLVGLKDFSFYYTGGTLLGGGLWARTSDTTFGITITPSMTPGIVDVYARGTTTLGNYNDAFTSDSVRVAIREDIEPVDLTIAQIQGPFYHSSHHKNKRVRTTGIVTAFTHDHSGFWMQSSIPDDNMGSSEGLFVAMHQFGINTPQPLVGDDVAVVGLVDELGNDPTMTVTTLNFVDTIRILSSGNPIPSAFVLPGQIPGMGLPTKNAEASRYIFECLEGMLVRIQDAVVVGSTNPDGRSAVLAGKGLNYGSGYYPWTGLNVVLIEQRNDTVDYNPERLIIGERTLASPLTVSNGDTIKDLTGVLDYQDGMFVIQPIPGSVQSSDPQPLPSSPFAQRFVTGGALTLTTFDLENFYDTVGTQTVVFDDSFDVHVETAPALTSEEFFAKLTKITSAIQYELLLPPLIALQGIDHETVLESLAASVNAASAKTYKAISPACIDSRGLQSGFLVDTSAIAIDTVFLLSSAAADTAFGAASAIPTARPLIGKFRWGAIEFYVVNVDLVDKSTDDPLYSREWPPTRFSEVQRKKQAEAVREYLDLRFSYFTQTHIIVMGDFNDFSFSEPGEGIDNPVAIVQGDASLGQVVLTDASSYVPKVARFTDIRDGNASLQKQILVSPSLVSSLRGSNILHINSRFPETLASDPGTLIRSSGSDPYEVRF